jgi:hypothetical protein
MLIVTFWGVMQIFKRLHLNDEILKVRPFLNSENFKFKEYFKLFSNNEIKFTIYFCKLQFTNCAKLTPATNTNSSPMAF